MSTEYYIERTYANNPDLDKEIDPKVVAKNIADGVYEKDPTELVDEGEEANLITSFVKGRTGIHAPAIDIDVPCELVPSSQIGHYHLYIHHEMSWGQYKNILQALTAAGVVETGYTNASVKKGYTSLRPIGKVKPGIKIRTSSVLAQNAALKHQNYMLTQELQRLKAKPGEPQEKEEKIEPIATEAQSNAYNKEITTVTEAYAAFKKPAVKKIKFVDNEIA